MKIKLTNDRLTRLAVLVEPWAEIHELEAQESCVVAFSEPAGEAQVCVEGDRIVVYGWEGAVLIGIAKC
jgi:hypothetical protein